MGDKAFLRTEMPKSLHKNATNFTPAALFTNMENIL